MSNVHDKDKDKKPTIYGVDEGLIESGTSKFDPSSNETLVNKDKEATQNYNNLKDVTSNKDLISENVKTKLNSGFTTPYSVTQADAWLSSQLRKIKSGKTSYTDEIEDIMSQISNREKFSYDVDTDPLFQQALASVMNSGKQAMQDTIGQASALTGGYGSTYATSAGNQAYNAYIEDAYNNLPEYYQMAMNKYQMEGDEMYRQLGMYSDADAREYDRMLTAYDATFAQRNQAYNEVYGQFRDTKSDAFAMANLQLSEHGQKVSDAYNMYMASSNEADKAYERLYNEWNAKVNQSLQWVQLLNSDAQANRNYDRAVFESNRAYDRGVFESNRAYDRGVYEFDQNYKLNEASLYSKNSGGNGGGPSAGDIPWDKAIQRFNELGGGEKGYSGAIAYLIANGYDIDISDPGTNQVVMDIFGFVPGTATPINWNDFKIWKNYDSGGEDKDRYMIYGPDGKYQNQNKTYSLTEIENQLKAEGYTATQIEGIIANLKSGKFNDEWSFAKK